MGPLNWCNRHCFSANFDRYDEERLHQHIERVPELLEPMMSSRVEMSVEYQRALSQMEKMVCQWPLSVSTSPEQPWICIGRLCYLTFISSRCRCLKSTVSDKQGEFNVETIYTFNRKFYVDDSLKSVPTTDKAAFLSGQIRCCQEDADLHVITSHFLYAILIAVFPVSSGKCPLSSVCLVFTMLFVIVVISCFPPNV